jgi:PAS domain S-box-containing protein
MGELGDKDQKSRGSADEPDTFLQSVLDALSAHVAVLDNTGRIVAANDAWKRFAERNGLTWGDAGLGCNYLEVCEKASGSSADEAADVAHHIREILERRCDQYRKEYPCHSPDENRWFQVRLTCFEDCSGMKVVAAHESVTELKEAEQAVKLSEERFRAIFESAQELIFLKGPDLAFSHVNPSVEKLFGLSADQIVGLRAEDLFGEEAGNHINDVDRRVLDGETVEEEHTRPVNGIELTFHDTSVPLRDSDGNTIGICLISRDISGRLKASSDSPLVEEEYRSAAMIETLRKSRRAATADGIVLLLGESGSGKDYLARWIHNHSKRARGPFFSINCAAVSKELAESELFGHESGAFTGARTRKKGLLELAEGGTLLLNEIGELPISLQAKLLTFLDTKSFLRVGGNKPVSISARLIAATHRNLETEVVEGRFLEALFYRINVFMIRVPPLRERQEDLALIVKDLLRGLETELQLGYAPKLVSSELTALARYSWPGNVRELRNVLERSLMLSDEGRLVLDIPEGKDTVPDSGMRVSLVSGQTLKDSLDQVTRFLLMEALQKSEGNAKQAARLLGISRDSIYRHFRRLDLGSESRTQFKV